MSNGSGMGRKLFVALVAVLFFYICLPLLLPVLMGGIFAVLLMNSLDRLEKKRVPTWLGASGLTIFLALLILLPLGAMVLVGAKSGFTQLQLVRQMPPRVDGGDWIDGLINSSKVNGVLEWVTRWFPIDIDALRESVHDVVHATSLKLADLLGQFLTALPGFVLGTAVAVVSVFFFLLDGRNFIRFLRRNSLFTVPQTDILFENLGEMCRSVILASVVSGLAQTLVMVFGCLVMGIHNIPIIAALVFLGSFVPVIGATPATIGVCVQQFLTGNTQVGLVMAVVALMVAMTDNFVRPYFLRGSTNLHPLVAFVAAFGGLQTFGFPGVFLGPIIAGLFITTVKVLLTDDNSQLARP
jgi:predicted PurR-regulated permease PerM